MQPLRIYIVEDEPLIVATIETALKKYGFEVVGDAESFEDTITDIKKNKPDLVLLDIQLEGQKDGVDLALELETRNIPYLFLTSQTDPDTIERVKQTNPLGFIVKPFTEAGLRSNIDLAWHTLSQSKDEFLVIKSEGETYRLDQREILYLKAFDNYCYVITEKQKYLVPKTLKHTAQGLNPTHFVRSHRSFVVNLQKISKMTSDNLVLNGQKIPLSSANKQLIKKRMRW